MSRLEGRYRRVLQVAYPLGYLAEREEEMLTTLLDSARPGQQRPRASEVVDLVRCGLAVRAERAGGVARRSAARGGGVLAAGLLAFVVVVVLGPQVGTSWTSSAPPLMLPLWTVFALVLGLAAASPGRLRRFAPVVALVGVLAVALGPATMILPRLGIVAVLWLAVLVCLAPPARRRTNSAAVAVGAVMGGLVASRLVARLESANGFAGPRGEYGLGFIVDLPTWFLWTWPVLVLAVVGIAWWRPRAAIGIGLLGVPVLLLAEVATGGIGHNIGLAHNIGLGAGPWVVLSFVVIVSTAASAILLMGAVRTLRPDRS